MKYVNKEFNAILNINSENIKKNYLTLKKLAKDAEVASCVKANAYGLGMIEICSILKKMKCKSFFVATVEEALLLRNKFKSINIYLLNGINNISDCKKLVKNRIIIVINNTSQFLILKEAYNYFNFKILSGIHLDTGMNRLGWSQEDIDKYYMFLKKYLDLKLVMTHMISSEKKSSLNRKQLDKFNKIKKKFSFNKNIKFSLSNSNAIFLGKNYHFNLVRAGGFLYGLDLSNKNQSKTVVSLQAKVIQISKVNAGKSIGYGAEYIAKKNLKIATLAIGYADGLPRNYKGYAVYKSNKVPFVGRISMDLSCIDVTKLKKISVNDWVEIFGRKLSVSLFSDTCNTIPYETTCRIGPRVKRIYNI